ncbi:hypothetical protein ACFVWY_05750 [Streptomyces sp. NPDC058195]|uniref:hypothetical protein n=1 Tax=Streptomyces sp. NPDC058195 TaxID=3346375 RepID=UPI0036E42F0E
MRAIAEDDNRDIAARRAKRDEALLAVGGPGRGKQADLVRITGHCWEFFRQLTRPKGAQ